MIMGMRQQLCPVCLLHVRCRANNVIKKANNLMTKGNDLSAPTGKPGFPGILPKLSMAIWTAYAQASSKEGYEEVGNGLEACLGAVTDDWHGHVAGSA